MLQLATLRQLAHVHPFLTCNSPPRCTLPKVLISRILGTILADFKFGSASVVAGNRAGDMGPPGGY
jgi:hypothetical protein